MTSRDEDGQSYDDPFGDLEPLPKAPPVGDGPDVEFRLGEATISRRGRTQATRPRPRPQPAQEGDTRREIRIVASELHRLATEAENAILDANLAIYQRGSDLVRPITREVSAAKGRQTFTAALQTLDVAALLDLYCQTARWEKFDARAMDWVPANPPKDVAAIHLSRAGRWAVPTIAGVVTTPTMRPDGSILSASGYDRATRLFHFADPAFRMPDLPAQPSRQAAEEALEFLRGLLVGFPFVEEADRVVALAALLTVVVRGAMQVAPLFGIRATTAGTGKSYLADLIAALATGRPCPVISAGATSEETEKRLTGLLLEGFPILSVDNLNGELGGDLLCQAVERPLIRLRRLGGSEITEVESRATLLATGNGLRVRGDMVRRTLLCTLDANMERPELRTFAFDPVRAVIEDRGRYVAAALTIVRAFRLSRTPTLPALASFDDWSDTVRSALAWLGCPDPCSTMERAREEDPELEEIREVITLWERDLGGDGYTVRDLADAADKRDDAYSGSGSYVRPEFRDALLRIAGERGAISTRRLGYWIKGRAGRIVDGRTITRAGEAHGGIVRWSVRQWR